MGDKRRRVYAEASPLGLALGGENGGEKRWCMRRLALGLALGGRWWAVNDHRFTEEAAPLFRLRVGEQRPLSETHSKMMVGAKRRRVYEKASPLRGSQIKDLLSDSGLRPSLARVRCEDNAPFSAAHPRKIGGAIRPRVYAEASPLWGLP